MAQRSGLLIAAIIVLHVGGLLTCLSLGLPYWIQSSSKGSNHTLPSGTGVISTDRSNHTSGTNVISRGLWVTVCTDKEHCPFTPISQLPTWFHAFQGLYTAGLAFTDIAVLLNYFVCCCVQTQGVRVGLNVAALVLTMLAVIVEGAAISLMSLGGYREPSVIPGALHIGPCFYMAIAGAVLTLIAALLLAVENCRIQSNPDKVKYRNLQH